MAIIRIANDPDLGRIAHLQGSGVCGTETLCGNVDTFTDYEDITGEVQEVTCTGCLDVVYSVLESLSATELAKLKKNKGIRKRGGKKSSTVPARIPPTS